MRGVRWMVSLSVLAAALVFGGRRRELAPLVYEARNWAHGVLIGASVASETTAAATGARFVDSFVHLNIPSVDLFLVQSRDRRFGA